MKKVLFIIICFAFLSTTFAVMINDFENYKNANSAGIEKELLILLTTGEKEVFTKMVWPYLNVSSKSWEKRTLLIWGPSEKLFAEDADIKEIVKKMKDSGIILKACKWCADQYKVGDQLAALGFEVAYMGTPLTEALQNNQKVMTF